MGYNYSTIAATALRLLTKFGQPVTLRVNGAAAYDPTTMTMVPTVTDYPRTGAPFDYRWMGSGEVLQNGTLAQAADKQLWLSVGTVAPTVADHILLADSSIWSVTDVKAINPSGVAVIYECRIRQ